MTKKRFTADFKAKVAIEAIKGNKTINELTTEFGVHASQLQNWKKQLLASCKDLFSGKKEKIEEIQPSDILLEDYVCHGALRAPMLA